MSTNIVYWARTYQVDNTKVPNPPIGNITVGNVESYNQDVLWRFLYGDKAPVSDFQKLPIDQIAGQSKLYEIVTFTQSNNTNTLDTSLETKCIYSIIIKKEEEGEASETNFEGMWLCVFCPRRVCEGTGCGIFNIWKVNLDGLPHTKLSWSKEGDPSNGISPKFCITTNFVDSSGTTVGDKVVIGIVSDKVYLSPKSFFLEGRHEDILKKMPNPDGMNITIIGLNRNKWTRHN